MINLHFSKNYVIVYYIIPLYYKIQKSDEILLKIVKIL
jgi:hypothetical protein